VLLQHFFLAMHSPLLAPCSQPNHYLTLKIFKNTSENNGSAGVAQGKLLAAGGGHAYLLKRHKEALLVMGPCV
jgi:hypothetical protein